MPARDLAALQLCGRLTLCATHEDILRYDRCFAGFFSGPWQEAEILPNPEAPPMLPGSATIRRQKQAQQDDEKELEVGAVTDKEILRHRKLSSLSLDEVAQISQLIVLMRDTVAMRRSRRHRKSTKGEIDIHRTAKAAQARGGESDRLYFKTRREMPRKRVLLLDISGSMAPFADGLLRFGYAAFRCAPRHTEVFTIGTRLTRLTPWLRPADPEAALAAASHVVPDWSGGTRLGDQMKAFLDIWGQRGLAHGAIVVIASDGWEHGDATLLGAQMRRLRGFAHRIIWANPHKSQLGFEPLTRGMQSALPALDHFVAGSTLDELERLMRVMGDGFHDPKNSPSRFVDR